LRALCLWVPAVKDADPSRTLLLPSGGFYDSPSGLDLRAPGYYVGDVDADFRRQGEGAEYTTGYTLVGQWHDDKRHGRFKVSEFERFNNPTQGQAVFADEELIWLSFSGPFDGKYRAFEMGYSADRRFIFVLAKQDGPQRCARMKLKSDGKVGNSYLMSLFGCLDFPQLSEPCGVPRCHILDDTHLSAAGKCPLLLLRRCAPDVLPLH